MIKQIKIREKISNKNKEVREKISYKNLKEKARQGYDKKRVKNGTYSTAMTVVVFGIVVIINAMAQSLPATYTQFDVSQQKIYTIGEETENYLKGLEQDVTLYYIAEEGGEDATIQQLLERYEAQSSHVKVIQKDPVRNPGFTAQYTEEQVTDNSIIVVSGEKSKVVDYSKMYETTYESYSSSSSSFDGEGQITSAIIHVTTEDAPVLYTLTGHGEIEIGGNIEKLIEKNNITVQNLNLITEEAIPEDAECILIASPEKDLTEEESDKIISYLENGGKAMIFSDYSETAMPNFESVLENYGLQRSDGVVFEGDSQHYAAAQMPYYILPELKESDAISGLSEDGNFILMPMAQAIKPLEQYRDSLVMTEILGTTEESYIKTDLENIQSFEKEDTDEKGPFCVGMSVKEDLGDGKETQLIYFSSSALMNDSVDSVVGGANSQLVVNALGTICEMEETVSIPSKSLMIPYLNLTAYDVHFWSVVSIGVIPVVILGAGIVIWLKRRKQ